MDQERLLNIKEAASYLGISDKKIKDLVKNGQLEAYQIGGMYLRFKLEHLQDYKNGTFQPTVNSVSRRDRESSALDGAKDFLYFNDFYILAVLVIAALLFIILKNIS